MSGAAVAIPGETDYQRLLRDTAAARRRHAEQNTHTPYATHEVNGRVASSSASRIDSSGSASRPVESLYPRLEDNSSHTPHTPHTDSPSHPYSHSLRSDSVSHSVDPSPNCSLDAELARRLQLEEARHSQSHTRPNESNRHTPNDINRRRAEQARMREDERIARELIENERAAAEAAAAADAEFARQLYEREESAARRAQEDAEAAKRTAELDRQKRSAEAHDAELARSLQLEEEAEAAQHQHSPRDGNEDVRPPVEEESITLIDPEEDAQAERRAMEEVHRRHAESNRLAQLQNSADLLNQQHRDANAASSASSSSSVGPSGLRSREQLIRRLHRLQGEYPSLAPDGRSASFHFDPTGRLIVTFAPRHIQNQNVDPQHANDVEQLLRPSAEEEQEQREALEEFARQRQQQQQEREEEQRQREQEAAPGFMGMIGNLFQRYSYGRMRGIPFPLSLMVQPRDASSSYGSRSGNGSVGGELDVDSMSYDDLLRLEDALGSVKPRVKPATQEELEQLPVRTFKKPNNKSTTPATQATSATQLAAHASAPATAAEPASCSICLCDFEDGDEIKTLSCLHSFHSAEIDKWLLTNELCPICRFKATG